MIQVAPAVTGRQYAPLDLFFVEPENPEVDRTPLDKLGQLGFDFMYIQQNPSFPPPKFGT